MGLGKWLRSTPQGGIAFACAVLLGTLVTMEMLLPDVDPESEDAASVAASDEPAQPIVKHDTEAAIARVEAAVEAARNVSVTAQTLSGQYAANEVAAQRFYEGKIIEVTGRVESIQLDFLNEPFVVLSGHDRFTGVHLNFVDEAEDRTARLRQGQSITVRCTDVGEVIGSPILSNCDWIE